MLIKYTNDEKKYFFLNDKENNDCGNNSFTVLVGKNGTGKSRLLQGVIQTLLAESMPSDVFIRNNEHRFTKKVDSQLLYDYIPNKVIAVSTSPFDRFPILKPSNYQYRNQYIYLGLKGLPSRNLGLSYMSRIINSLIESIIYNPERANIVVDVLSYLGYSESLETRFHLNPSVRKMEVILQSENPAEMLYNQLDRPVFVSYGYSTIRPSMELTDENIHKCLSVFSRLIEKTKKPRFDVEISRDGIQILDSKYSIDEDFIFLIKSGLAQLRDVTFIKEGISERLRINDASSGEQSVVMSLFGIASQIEDKCLICIDEPEICLHPEWQEKYIELLITTFSNYKECQFLIATHSPQIISNLDITNCYIMPMETGISISAAEFVNKSADFQLVNVFKSPGFKNEYLSRIALNVFSKVSKRKKFDEVDLVNFNILQDSFNLINEDDPIHGLIIAINEMYLTYA